MRAVMIAALCIAPSAVGAQEFLDEPGWFGSVSEKRGQYVATTRIEATRLGDRWVAEVECEVTDPKTGRFAVHRGSGTLQRGGTHYLAGAVPPLGNLVLDLADMSLVIGPACAVGELSVTLD
jgi:hypothetical protein